MRYTVVIEVPCIGRWKCRVEVLVDVVLDAPFEPGDGVGDEFITN
jgi:hypothetical protein